MVRTLCAANERIELIAAEAACYDDRFTPFRAERVETFFHEAIGVLKLLIIRDVTNFAAERRGAITKFIESKITPIIGLISK